MNLPATRPPRALGLASQPTLRLALGYKDPAKRGAPVKTDYFVAKEGRDGEYAAAARKFREVYGDQPREIDIMLPTSIGQALDVRYRAFKGNPADDDGGRMVAVGEKNFALFGVLGGPDTLTVWNQDGTVDAVDIAGPDDPVCAELGVALYTTFKFSIPSVLGAGGVCEITSKGRKTTDNLFERLVTLYGWFGVKTPFVVRPTLVLRSASGQPVIKTKDGPKRIKSNFYALDIRVKETLDEMVDRMEQQRAALGTSPTQALYGAPADRPALEAVARELTAAPSPDVDSDPSIKRDSESDGQQAEEASTDMSDVTPGGASSVPDSDEDLDLDESDPGFQVPGDVAQLQAAAEEASFLVVDAPEFPNAKGKTLGHIATLKVADRWFAKALRIAAPGPLRDAVIAFARVNLPEVYEAYQSEQGGQGQLG